jgi:hypothetical protein
MSAEPPKPRLHLAFIVLFCLLIGLLTSIWGYSYVGGNQVEQLPLVMRAADSSFLSNDFFVNGFDRASPRFFFAGLLALLEKVIPLPGVYLLLTILCNSLTALVTALFARDLFDGSDGAALFTALSVMVAKTFWLGYSNVIYRTPLEPSLLVMPLLLLAIWAGLRQRPLVCAIAAGTAALFHPLMGLETGAIALSVLALEQLAHRTRPDRFQRSANLQVLLGAGAILAGFAAVVLAPNSRAPHISSQQFIQIMAIFRHPHHYLPSTFGIWQYVQAAVFVLPVAVAWRLGRSTCSGIRQLIQPMLFLCAILAVLCLGGYIFVEFIPTRLWVTAQTFRLLYIFKWLGLVLAAGWIGYVIDNPSYRKDTSSSPANITPPEPFWQYVLHVIILLTGLLSPLSLAIVFCFEWVRFSWKRWHKLAHSIHVLLSLAALATALLLLILDPADSRIIILLPIFTLMALSMLFFHHKVWAILINLLLTAVILAALFWSPLFLPARLQPFFEKPILSLADLSGEDRDLTNWVRQNTPPDAIFLVNPSQGLFRVLADRAIVVDFTAFPFNDLTMAGWQQRLFDVYGIPKLTGFPAVPELRDNYTAITDTKMSQLKQEYGATYAVLYRWTKTDFPTLFETDNYQVVKIK